MIPSVTDHCDPVLYNALINGKSSECASFEMELPTRDHDAVNTATEELKAMLASTVRQLDTKVGLHMPDDMGTPMAFSKLEAKGFSAN